MKVTFTEHLVELRRRVVSILVLYVLIAVLSYPLSKPLLAMAKSDLLGNMQLVIIEPQEAVVAYINVSLFLSLMLSMPAIAYHLWAFLSPGLIERERRMMLYLVLPSTALFAFGAAFGYKVLLPIAFRVLIGEAVPLATPMISLASFISFVAVVLAALGILFQMPLATYALTRLGVVNPKLLSAYRKHMIVLILLVAGMITPDPSPIPQLILALPMVLLYEAGIITSKLAGGSDARKR